jgi:acetylornithine/N-succinyldiaminopimelate aminotransferase
MSHTEQDLVELGHTYLYPNYRQPPLVLSHGKGCEIWDKSGRRYLDLTGGIAVTTLGHAHPELSAAIADQAAKLMHTSNYFFNEPNVLLAEALCRHTKMARAFFCNSGTEAIEASLKLVRRHFFDREQPDRHRIIAFQKSFHGRTMGSLAATGQSAYRDGFGPLGSVTHVPFGDEAAVRAAMSDDVAAIIVEPVQGEGGVIPAPKGFLSALRKIADDAGAFLIADEIQTGVGRTGAFLACEHAGIQADVVAMAKGLGGGFPIGAMLCQAHLEKSLPPGSHGTTYGGNPLASRAALTVLSILDRDGLVERTRKLGAALTQKLRALKERFPDAISEVRGQGLLQAAELGPNLDLRDTLGQLRDAGLLLTAAGGVCLRFSPALIVEDAQLDEAMTILSNVLGGSQ